MSLQEEVDLLRRIPLFAKVEPPKLKLLAFASERVTFEAGQELFHQGDMPDAAYIIIDGTADVVLDTERGRVAVATIGRNELVGEIGVICDVPRTATIQAKSRLVTLKVSKDLLLRMITDFPSMAIEILRSMAHRLEHANAQLTQALAERC